MLIDAFKSVLEHYECFVVQTFGYDVAIHLEEVILIIMGIFIGELLMAISAGKFVYALNKVKDFEDHKVKMVRKGKRRSTKYYVHFKSLPETVHQIFILAFSPWFTIKDYTIRDEKRTRNFVFVMGVTAILVLIFAILSIFSTLSPIPPVPHAPHVEAVIATLSYHFS